MELVMETEDPDGVKSLQKVDLGMMPAMPEAPALRSVRVCMHCGVASEKLKACQGCRCAYYCSKECLTADRKRHKPECKRSSGSSAKKAAQ